MIWIVYVVFEVYMYCYLKYSPTCAGMSQNHRKSYEWNTFSLDIDDPSKKDVESPKKIITHIFADIELSMLPMNIYV